MKSILHCFLNKNVWILFLMLAMLSFKQASAQQVTVKGTVKDTLGGLVGVGVRIAGSGQGTLTDINGAFQLKAAPADVINFTYTGYEPKTINLNTLKPQTNGDYVFTVTLIAKDNSLNEVVVVGFGKQKKVNLTAAVSTIDAKELAGRPVQNVTQALQGLSPGLNISQNNGSLESRPSINIRGTGSISTFASASPLILVDGMEGSINLLNPQDVESISILKDASAASIYGSRAAFGVILVTTKKGKAGRVNVNYNNSFRSTRPVLMPEMMDSYTFAQYFNAAGTNAGTAPHFSAEHLQRILNYQNGTLKASVIPTPNNPNFWGEGYAYGNDNNDWYDVMYRKQSFSQEHSLSISGGNDKTTFYLAGNLLDQGGLMTFNQDVYSRHSLTAKISSKLSSWAEFNFTNRFLREGYQRPANLTDTFYQDLGRQGWPTLPLYDPNGYLFSSPSPALGMRDGGKDNNRTETIYQQFQLVLEPVKSWKTFIDLNYRTRNDFRHWDSQMLYNYDVKGNPYVYKNSSNVYEYGFKENYYNINAYSEYTKSLQKHNFKGMVGFQLEKTGYRDLSAQRNGIIVSSLPTLNTTSGTDYSGAVVAPVVSGQYQNWSTMGFFSRINYDYDGRYLIEGNLRYDATSRFRADKRWNWFPSVSLGWNVAREDFFKPLAQAISTLKFRASYGSLGNQNTNLWYPTYITMPIGTASGSWLINNARPNTASSPLPVSTTLFWETVRTYNLGLDWAALNSRLTGSLDVFDRKTANMLGKVGELPSTFGTTIPPSNNTDLVTKGFDLEIAWNDRLKNGLRYGVKFILSDNQTTVTRFLNITKDIGQYREGQKLGEIWGYTTLGIAKTQAEMNAHLASSTNGQSVFGSQWAAGDIMYADYNGDGKIDWGNWTEGNSGDAHIIGNSTPRFRFGFDLNAAWKNFDVRAFLQGVMKRDYWQGSSFFWGAVSDKWWSMGLVQHQDYFRANPTDPMGQNLDAYYPRPLFGTGKNQQTQTRYLQDASYIRLKNLQVGYTLPASVSKRLHMQNLRLFASGENLWTGTGMAKMFDPETVDGGVGGSVYPLSRVLSLGLSVTF
ncbi:SusC/RagA family TonB-linked outer membrane protein [Mucilaginibacter terrae]|uniref:TonB-linked SusC/RagA family outer membrane protein n=1 Tax=Mucilaginibacter terrae TaxID=1955052 RepID=A0ABU3GV69_9SPHI|nr:TonB-dependent receptor [Mucilaginibacter terrae]MDT3403677.1 TonB-linked SusC/RagA family outer membrane protein [Mucilaginibacter terrae]